jgi:hypothetical protein
MAPGGKRGGELENQSLSSYVREMMSSKDYEMWFSNRLSQKYVGAFPLRYNLAVCDEQRQDIAREASSVLSIYSVLVYYVHPNSKEMQKGLEASRELSANFKLVKGWLEANGGKRIADEFLENVSRQRGG